MPFKQGGVGGDVDGGRELSDVEQRYPIMGRLLRRYQDAINTLARNTASSATGENAPPPPLAGLNISTGGEMMHVTINHPGAVIRNIRYFVEIHTDPAFGTPVIIHDAGSSRSPKPFALPTKDSVGVTHNYYVRAYAQNSASQTTPILVSGGASSPIAYTMTGATRMDFSPPQGSGTGPNTGEGGQGLGRVQRRD